MKESQTKKFRILLPLVFIALFMLMLSVASADEPKVYNGTVNSDAGAKLYDGAGTKNHQQINNIVVAKGTALLITGEENDTDGDKWYKVTVTVDGVEYQGYLYSGRVDKGAEITPTPEPTAEPTQEVTPEPTKAPVVTSVVDESTKSSTDEKESAKESSGSSGGFGAWKWIIILVIVIVIFMLIYTIWVKKNEERLEREIERYSGKSQYEPLDGENEEDYAEAKSNYYDHIGLGGNNKKDLAEEIGGDDVKIDMSGVFDDEQPLKKAGGKTKDFAQDATLSELIASLESKLGKDKLENEDEKVLEVKDEAETESAESEEPEETEAEETEISEESESSEESAEVSEAEDKKETKSGSDFVEDKIKEADDKIKQLETVIPDFVKKGGSKADAARFAEIFEEEEEDPGVMDIRDYLETLREDDILVHKIYGEGRVVDNTDSEIIQVAFGKNMRYLKKEKLVQKDLIIL